jgi:hypothetical protein
MTGTENVDRFLEAEQQATALVDELERLQTEMKNYSTANQSLDNAVKRFEPLSDRFADAAATLQDVSIRLRENGTPQVVQGQESLLAEFGELKASLRELYTAIQQVQHVVQSGNERVTANNDEQRKFVETSVLEMGKLIDEHREQVDKLRSMLEVRLQAFSETLEAQNSTKTAEIEKLQGSINKLESRFTLVLGAIGIVFLTVLCVGLVAIAGMMG